MRFVPDPHEVVQWFCWTQRVRDFRQGRDEDLRARAELYLQQDQELRALQLGLPMIADRSDSAVEMENEGEDVTDSAVHPMAVRADAEPVLQSPPPPPQYSKAAALLAEFVATCISHMVVETRGKLYFATPQNRVLRKVCYRDLQHLELGGDQGNAPYGIVYSLWVEVMASCHGDIAVPRDASKKGTSPAGNIIESYKMIAEQVLLHDPQHVSPSTQDCVRAALLHLRFVTEDQPPPSSTAVWVSTLINGHFVSCTTWIPDLDYACVVARRLLEAFQRLSPDASEASDDWHRDASEVQRPPGNTVSRGSSDVFIEATDAAVWARCVLVRHGQDNSLEVLVIRRQAPMVYALPEDVVLSTRSAAETALCALSLKVGLKTSARIAHYLGSHPSPQGIVKYFAAWSSCAYGAEHCAGPEHGTCATLWVREAAVGTLCLEEENQRQFLLAACANASLTTEAL